MSHIKEFTIVIVFTVVLFVANLIGIINISWILVFVPLAFSIAITTIAMGMAFLAFKLLRWLTDLL